MYMRCSERWQGSNYIYMYKQHYICTYKHIHTQIKGTYGIQVRVDAHTRVYTHTHTGKMELTVFKSVARELQWLKSVLAAPTRGLGSFYR
jgi:hypothetical protein